MVAHHKVLAGRNAPSRVVRSIQIARRYVLVRQFPAVYVHVAGTNLNGFARQSHHALDERLRAVQRIPEHNHVSALDRLKTVDKLVDEDALLIRQERIHAGPFNLYRLIEKNHDDDCQAQGHGKVTGPAAQLAPQWRKWGFFRRSRRTELSVFLHAVGTHLYHAAKAEAKEANKRLGAGF